MATDIERLVVSLEASISKYERTMQKALDVSNKNAKKIESRWAKLNIGGAAFAGFAKGAAAALLPAISLAAVVNGAKNALKEFGDVADNARASGLDPELYQGLAYQFQLAGVEAGQAASALATFAKNSGLAVEGKGRMVTALKALDVGLLENIRSATTQAERIRIVADALASTEDPAKRAAIATAAFGDAGAKLAGAFDGGAASIDATMRNAQELGVIVDRELIAKADELGDEFDTATKILDLQLKQALVNLAPVLTWLTGLAGDFAGSIGSALDSLNSVADRRTSTLAEQLQILRDAPGKPIGLGGMLISEQDRQAQMRELESEIFRRGEKFSMGQLSATTPPATADIPTRVDLVERNEAAAAALRQAEAVKQLISDLQFEGELIGKSAVDQMALRAARQAGADATAEQITQIDALVRANFDEQQQVQALQDLYDELGQVGMTAVNGIIDAMADGKIEAQELGDILSNVLGMLGQFFLNQAFGSLGGGGNILSSLFGGGRAAGGPVEAGKIYKVNENTPNSEYFAPGMDGMILPRLSKSSVGGGASGGNVFHIDARGAQRGVGEEIRQALDNFSRFHLPGRVNQINGDPLARG